MLTKYADDEVLSAWQSEFEDLTIHQAQYTMVVMDDTMSDPANVTNLDNGTSGENYTPSGHILRIRKGLIPVTESSMSRQEFGKE